MIRKTAGGSLSLGMVVYFSPKIDRHAIAPLLEKDGIRSAVLDLPLTSDPDSAIIVIPPDSFDVDGLSLLNKAGAFFFVLNQESELERLNLPDEILHDYSVGQLDLRKLRNLIEAAELRKEMNNIREERDAHLHRLKELNQIGIALSTERDPIKLLNMILQKSREITSADAGSLYLVEGDDESGKELRFKISQNDSMKLNYEEYVMPITKSSIAGCVATTGEALRISDAYRIGEDKPFAFNRHFDESTGYRTTSILAVPMKNHFGDILGVIQLINRKKDFSKKLTSENSAELIESFDKNDEELISSMASQAAVAWENSILLKSIQRLFEGFVTAAVTAIESRDPTTSGHSFRVANLTVGLAVTVERAETGKFRGFRFNDDQIKEMRYAALLHDFGKVGVRENVLVKAKKLYPRQMDLIKSRFEFAKKSWEAECYKSKLNLLLATGPENYEKEVGQIDLMLKSRMDALEDYLRFILQSNEPTVLPEGNFEKLLRIAAESELNPRGPSDPLLTNEEVLLLSIRKGSLSDLERMEIESHVTHTFAFLSKIPWTSELKKVPTIAYGHHEKLDGSGYPNHLKGEDIPVQTRIMTISDIYDALTASDRPYKAAVPVEDALDILSDEVSHGQLDADLFQLFLESKVYELSGAGRHKRF